MTSFLSVIRIIAKAMSWFDDVIFPIIDARYFESYNEGFITNAYNIDLDLLYEADEETLDRIKYIINQ